MNKVKFYGTEMLQDGTIDYHNNPDYFVCEQNFVGAFRDELGKSVMITQNDEGVLFARRFFQDYLAVEGNNGLPIVVGSVYTQLEGKVVTGELKERIEKAFGYADLAKSIGQEVSVSKLLGDMPVELRRMDVYSFDTATYGYLEEVHENNLECPVQFAVKIDKMAKQINDSNQVGRLI